MTEPTPAPDEGEGLRTRRTSGGGRLATVTLDTRMPSDGTPDDHDTNAHPAHHPQDAPNNRARDEQDRHDRHDRHERLVIEALPNARAAERYADGGHSDDTNVDAASYDTVPRNGANGDHELAVVAAWAAVSANGSYGGSGPTRLVTSNDAREHHDEHITNDTDRPPTGERNGNGRVAEGHATDEQPAEGRWRPNGENRGGTNVERHGGLHVARHGAANGERHGDANGDRHGGGDGERHGGGNGDRRGGGNGERRGDGNGERRGGGVVGDGRSFVDGARVLVVGTNRPGGDAGVAGDAIGLAGNGSRVSVTFGFGETAGVLPGDQRTFDDVEAGIVALWRQFGEQREQLLRDRLVLHYAPLVKYVAGRVGTGLPAHVEVADLIQSGIFGLVDAIEKFEPERGLKFETYAMQRIRGAILDDLRAQDWVPRSVRGRAREVERALERLGAQLRRTPTDGELADELGLSLNELRDVYAQLQLTSVVALDELAAAGRGPTPLADILEDQEALDPVALLVDQDNRRQLAQAIAHLAERDRVVVTLYYFENLTLAEIGRVLGVTESRVCQLHTRAVLRLRAKLLEKTDA
ncbi:FliA/WhiG family RNA polymerase sigma factor [Actinophytocola oryzae]|uniref:RNA polymerase sigma factor n=1 Tax=Actinophytocola oryzae TaxID=502181 RepID=A0A4R7UXF9_9PSEU|nr:FliA/WhiG family RNA polymerase sigma factor [Actinophytocola oryzae]